MSRAHGQLGVLLRNALRLDFRPRSTVAGSGRRSAPLVLNLVFYGTMGIALAASIAAARVPVEVAAAITYLVCGTLILLNVLVEYAEILLSPLDGDILYWRPIASRTLFLARALHLLVYVALVTGPLTLLPAAAAAWGSARPLLVFVAFGVGAWCSALLVTAAVVVVQASLLRRLPPEKFHRVLSGVQLAFMIAFVVASQLLMPALVQLESASRTAAWWRWIPGAWFAGLPALAAGAGATTLHLLPLALGVLGLAALLLVGSRSLAPRYVTDVEAARTAGHDAPVVPSRWAAVDGAFATLVGRTPLRRSGFEFLLAEFAGDRRLRTQLLAYVGIPIGMVVAGLLGTRGFDPYGAGTVQLSGALAEWGSSRGLSLLYAAAYMLAFFLASASRALCETPSWRAGWVFHAAPIERYDRFYTGVIAGLAYRVVLPALVLHAVILLVVWREPLHVAAHLVLPTGLAVLFFPLVQLLVFDAPFTREPVRNARAADLAAGAIAMLPLGAIGFAHYALRTRPWLPILAGCAACVLAMVPWWLLSRRLRNVFRHRTFQG